MEAISMRISDKYITSIRYIDPIGEIGDGLASDSTNVIALFVEHHHAMTLNFIQHFNDLEALFNLEINAYLEITDIVLFSVNGQIRRLAHPIRHIKPFNEFAIFGNAEDGR